jgi:ABC-2 type transport system ATP-binding protein
MTEQVLVLDSVSKIYGSLIAVNQLSLEIYRGEIFGLLGPNGAGKTTTLEMAVGLRTPSAGSIRVLGLDPRKDRQQLVEQIGVQPQEASLFPHLKVEEILTLFASFYRRALSVEQVLKLVELGEKRKSLIKSLSGGQKQRLLIALALLSDPQVLFLDEPTGPLDPQARRRLWDVIQEFRSQQRTVILTTHSMEEADALCDRIAIVDHGQLIALGSPSELVQQLCPLQTIRFNTSEAVEARTFEGLPGVKAVAVHGRQVEITTERKDETLRELVTLGNWNNIEVRSGTLEDVFLALTGRQLRD